MADDSGLSPLVKGWVVVCGLMMMISAPISGYVLWRRYEEARASEHWPAVAGVIREASVHEVNLGLQRSFQPDIAYEYTVNGHKFTGTRIRPLAQNFDTRGDAQKELGSLTVGRTVPVHYNPESPARSVLRPGAGFPQYAVLGIPFIMFAMGVGAMIVLYLNRN